MNVTHTIYYALSNLLYLYPTDLNEELLLVFSIREYDGIGDKYINKEHIGEIVYRKTDLWERILVGDRLKLRTEKLQSLIARDYSIQNPNYLKPYFVRRYEIINIFNLDDYMSFYISKYYFNVYYNIFTEFSSKMIYFSIAVDNSIASIINRFIFNIRIFNPIGNHDTALTKQFDIKLYDDRGKMHGEGIVDYYKLIAIDYQWEEISTTEKNPYLFKHDLGITSICKNDKKYIIVGFNPDSINFDLSDHKLCYKVFIQEQFMIDELVNVRHHLLGYSDDDSLNMCKNDVSIDLTYPKVIELK